MEERYTVEQVLEITVGILKGINIPVEFTQSVGQPVCAAINNLNQCIEALNRTKQTPQAKPEAEEPQDTEPVNVVEIGGKTATD